jgi:hypothetical protein
LKRVHLQASIFEDFKPWYFRTVKNLGFLESLDTLS